MGVSVRAPARVKETGAAAMNSWCEQLFSGIESRFQRLFAAHLESWGDAPGYFESAPLALGENAAPFSNGTPKELFCSRVAVRRAGEDIATTLIATRPTLTRLQEFSVGRF